MLNFLNLLGSLNSGSNSTNFSGQNSSNLGGQNAPNFSQNFYPSSTPNLGQNLSQNFTQNNTPNNTYQNAPNYTNSFQQPQIKNPSYSPDYPYGEFPVKYTKAGQEMLKAKYLNKGVYTNYNVYPNNFENASGPIYVNQNQQFANSPNAPVYDPNQYNINTQQNNQNSGLDINTLLPLLTNLSGGKFGSNDALKNILPLLSNRSQGGMSQSELIKFITNNLIKKQDANENSDNKNIDSYKKIDD